MKKSIAVIAIVISALLCIAFLRDAIIKHILSATITNITGSKTEIGNLSLSLLKQNIRIKNLKIYNPEGFPRQVLLEIPRINADLDTGSFLKGITRLKELDIDLKLAVIMKNKDGKLNVDSLKLAKKEDTKDIKPGQAAPAFKIDNLHLNIGWVIFKDLSSGAKPIVDGYDIQIENRIYKNIESPQQLISLLLIETLKPTAIQSAKIFGAASLTGIAFPPLIAAGLLTAKDFAEEEFKAPFDTIYDSSIRTLKELGDVTKETIREKQKEGLISAKVRDAEITVEISKGVKGGIKTKVSARKFILAQPKIAGGILYEISEKVK